MTSWSLENRRAHFEKTLVGQFPPIQNTIAEFPEIRVPGILITEIKTPETRRIEGLRDWGLLRANDLMNRWNFASGPG
jgi:hypothetical protein